MGIKIDVSADRVFTDSALIKAVFTNTGPETYSGNLWFQLYLECYALILWMFMLGDFDDQIHRNSNKR